MNALFWRLLTKEFKRADANLALSVLVIACGVVCVSASFSALSLYDLSTKRLSDAKVAAKKTLNLDSAPTKKSSPIFFNALILPKPREDGSGKFSGFANFSDSSLALFSSGDAREVVPALERRIHWREENCEAIICGMDAIIHSYGGALDTGVIMGAALADTLSFSKGDEFLFNGNSMRIVSVRPEKGDLGDVTIWTSLKQARRILGVNRVANALFVFGSTNFDSLADSVRRVFPNAEILRFSLIDSFSAKTKCNKKDREEALQACPEKRWIHRGDLKLELALSTSFVIVLLSGWFFVLSESRVKRREGENAILAANGVQPGLLFTLELARGLSILIIGLVFGWFIIFPVTIAIESAIGGVSFISLFILQISAVKIELWISFLTGALVLTVTCATALRSFNFSPWLFCSRT